MHIIVYRKRYACSLAVLLKDPKCNGQLLLELYLSKLLHPRLFGMINKT